ncbi:hypothetical protein HN592_00560 [Candidatus Woesearchaeota archaeon]|jgi:hypothetical protein|nr:hypothetical protein [Candidatus Woesearchaeota archaeon]MBT4368797.1 hypothetical protein [Candidatus Woesearchaeota archaeon]MBT4712086.1 hypothetical protein [Candidatus Woesearchaeota archaeon]MBT6639166.1 hypothetical protein [Candidatus Woesearchaeota archaeon]MBT7134366.1 hypothetical protein [Candidatus Woesearchaeota archaeon]
MAFSKSFAKKVEGSTYPKWVEVYLTYEEEITVEEEARKANIKLMKECIKDAKLILGDVGMKDDETISVAKSLFEKRASHEIYWKESKAKEKFDSTNSLNAQQQP